MHESSTPIPNRQPASASRINQDDSTTELPSFNSVAFLPSIEYVLKEEVSTFVPGALATLILVANTDNGSLAGANPLGGFCTQNCLLVVVASGHQASREHALQIADRLGIPRGRLLPLDFPRGAVRQHKRLLLATLKAVANIARPDVVFTDGEDNDGDTDLLNSLAHRVFAADGVSIFRIREAPTSTVCFQG